MRLIELGFVPGESFEIIAESRPGGDPIAVRIGGTCFGAAPPGGRSGNGADSSHERGRTCCRRWHRAATAHRTGWRAELRQDGIVQPPDRQPAEGRELRRRDRGAQGRLQPTTRPPAADYRVLDLPGTYSLAATTLDEAVTRDAVLGRLAGETPPDLIVNVVDATNLRLGLRLSLELQRLGRPTMVALNMADIAQRARHEHQSRSSWRHSWVARWWKPWPWPPVASVHCWRNWSRSNRAEATAALGWSPLRRRGDRGHAARGAPHPQ